MIRSNLRRAYRNIKVFIGLEDSKKSWKLAIINDDFIERPSLRAEWSLLLALLQKRFAERKNEVLVVYEAGLRGFVLCRQLRAAGYNCEVIPPHTVPQPKISRVKTDAIDALRLAEMAQRGLKITCEIPDEEREDLRQISRHLERLKRRLNAIRNSLRGKLFAAGIPFPFEPGSWTLAHLDYLRTVECRDGLRMVIDADVAQIDLLQEQRKKMLAKLKSTCASDAYARAVQIASSIPGIGWYTAIRILLELGTNLDRFANERTIAAFVGIVSREYSTGETTRRGRITGLGSGTIRAWLVQAAWVAMHTDDSLNQKFTRVWKNSGSKKKAVVAVARVLIVRLRACIISNQEYRITPVANAA